MMAAIALVASPVLAQTSAEGTSSTPTPTAKPGKPPKPRKICRSEATTPSRIRSSVCKTAEEWAREEGGGDHIAGVFGR
ncbi:hypothetical protein C1X73_31620 [Pseudomonas sp. FW305-130]|nr:hypothetical protein C1X73_31620 [Pseudomonas sp. FW305-130]